MPRTSAVLRETVCHLVHQVDHVLNRENAKALEPYGVTMYPVSYTHLTLPTILLV